VIEAVIFDWGGTLSVFTDIDMEDMWRMAAGRLAPERAEQLTALLVAVERQAWDRIRVDQHSFTLAQLLADASAGIGLNVTASLLEEASRHHLDAWTPHIHHDPDAVPVLQALRDMGIKIGLLSNTHWPRTFHEHFLARDGLVELIDACFYTCELPRSKPHPSAFPAALEGVGVSDPGRAVFVGDRPYDDVWGAQGAGLKAVLRRNPSVPDYDVEPDVTISALPELLPAVERWCAS
jgi:putative hydrolase of the HAD superfamily